MTKAPYNSIMKSTHTPRKRFGQNFLQDAGVIAQIANAIHPQPGEHLVETGHEFF